MKFYVTGRSDNYSKVAAAFALIKERGHEVTFEWTTPPMAKPYNEHEELAADYAVQGIVGVTEAEKSAAMFNYHPPVSWRNSLEEPLAELV